MDEYGEAILEAWKELFRRELHNGGMADCEDVTMEQMVEIRVNYRRDIKNWEAIKPTFLCPITKLNECLIWQCACDVLREIAEFRWNYAGSLQGHYVTPVQLAAIA